MTQTDPQKPDAPLGPEAPSSGGVVLPSGGDVKPAEGVEESRQVAAEVQAGLRCQGCQARLTNGLEFVRATASFELGPEGAAVIMRKETAYACLGRDCSEAGDLAQNATAVRPLRYGVGWTFLDDEQALQRLAEQTGTAS